MVMMMDVVLRKEAALVMPIAQPVKTVLDVNIVRLVALVESANLLKRRKKPSFFIHNKCTSITQNHLKLNQ
jgi:hypothetical protein